MKMLPITLIAFTADIFVSTLIGDVLSMAEYRHYLQRGTH